MPIQSSDIHGNLLGVGTFSKPDLQIVHKQIFK